MLITKTELANSKLKSIKSDNLKEFAISCDIETEASHEIKIMAKDDALEIINFIEMLLKFI